jgi:predicted ATPase
MTCTSLFTQSRFSMKQQLTFRKLAQLLPSGGTGLANLNPQQGHIIRKDSPKGRIFVYICGKRSTKLK